MRRSTTKVIGTLDCGTSSVIILTIFSWNLTKALNNNRCHKQTKNLNRVTKKYHQIIAGPFSSLVQKSWKKIIIKKSLWWKRGLLKSTSKMRERERVNDFLKVVHSTIFYGESCGAWLSQGQQKIIKNHKLCGRGND